MLLLAYGDPHGEYDALHAAVAERRPDCIVLMGDLTSDKDPVPLDRALGGLISSGIPIFWIHGNHDDGTPAHHDAVFEGPLSGQGLHGRVVEVAGVRLAGLGGVFRGRVWNPQEPANATPRFRTREEMIQSLPKQRRWKRGLPLPHRATIFPEDFDLLRSQGCDVLITHEAPGTFVYEKPGRTIRGFREIDLLAAEMGARLIIWGHHHWHEVKETPEGVATYGTRQAEAHWIEL